MENEALLVWRILTQSPTHTHKDIQSRFNAESRLDLLRMLMLTECGLGKTQYFVENTSNKNNAVQCILASDVDEIPCRSSVNPGCCSFMESAWNLHGIY